MGTYGPASSPPSSWSWRGPAWPPGRRGAEDSIAGCSPIFASGRSIARRGRPAGPPSAVHRRSLRAEERWGVAGCRPRDGCSAGSRSIPGCAGQFRDSDGRPPRHTFFYPIEQYDRSRPRRSGRAVPPRARRGGNPPPSRWRYTRKTCEPTLLTFKELLARRHGLLARDRQTGELRLRFRPRQLGAG